MWPFGATQNYLITFTVRKCILNSFSVANNFISPLPLWGWLVLLVFFLFVWLDLFIVVGFFWLSFAFRFSLDVKYLEAFNLVSVLAEYPWLNKKNRSLKTSNLKVKAELRRKHQAERLIWKWKTTRHEILITYCQVILTLH